MVKFINLRRSKRPDLREEKTVYLLRINIKIKRKSDKLDFKKLRPFKIEKELGPVIFKLKLPKEMKIYPVFYIVLLESALKKNTNYKNPRNRSRKLIRARKSSRKNH